MISGAVPKSISATNAPSLPGPYIVHLRWPASNSDSADSVPANASKALTAVIGVDRRPPVAAARRVGVPSRGSGRLRREDDRRVARPVVERAAPAMRPPAAAAEVGDERVEVGAEQVGRRGVRHRQVVRHDLVGACGRCRAGRARRPRVAGRTGERRATPRSARRRSCAGRGRRAGRAEVATDERLDLVVGDRRLGPRRRAAARAAIAGAITGRPTPPGSSSVVHGVERRAGDRSSGSTGRTSPGAAAAGRAWRGPRRGRAPTCTSTPCAAAWRRASASIAASGSRPITVSNAGASCTASTPGPQPTSSSVAGAVEAELGAQHVEELRPSTAAGRAGSAGRSPRTGPGRRPRPLSSGP